LYQAFESLRNELRDRKSPCAPSLFDWDVSAPRSAASFSVLKASINVAFLHVGEVGDADAALHAVGHFAAHRP
jgi:hypothetical protein